MNIKMDSKIVLIHPCLDRQFYNSLIFIYIFLQDTGGIADIIAQLCRNLPSIDELADFRKKTYIEECTNKLKKLSTDEGITIEEEDEIENCVNLLNEMKALIVVFDAIEHSSNLEDAIAEAMLRGVKYRVENFEQYFSPDTRAEELAWCLVRFSFSL